MKPNKPKQSWNSINPSQKGMELNEFFMEWQGRDNQAGNPSEDYRPGLTPEEMQDKILRDPGGAEKRRKIEGATERMYAGPDNKKSFPLPRNRSTPKGDRLTGYAKGGKVRSSAKNHVDYGSR